MKIEGGLLVDDRASLILIATNDSKSACEVSRACDLPLSTTYRKLGILLQHNLVKVSGEIENGRRHILYTNASKENQFKNSDRALSFMTIISKNPGIGFREIQRISGMTNGVVSHYLFQLQKRGLLKTRRSKRKLWLFPSDASQDEMSLMIQVRNDTSRAIILHLLVHESVTFHDIAKSIDKCPASISTGLSRLISEGIVKKTEETRARYFLRDPRRVQRAVSSILHPYKTPNCN